MSSFHTLFRTKVIPSERQMAKATTDVVRVKFLPLAHAFGQYTSGESNTTKKPMEGRYTRCSKISSSGSTLDSITRVKKYQTIKKESRGLFLFQRIAAMRMLRMNARLRIVVTGTKRERDLSNSW